MNLVRRCALLALSLFLLTQLPGCASAKKEDGLNPVLREYASLIRWGRFDLAWEQLEPKLRDKEPVTTEIRAAYDAIQVARYDDDIATVNADGTVTQLVRIEYILRDSQRLGATVDRQIWRYDETAQRWWLTTGLPKLNH